MNTEIEIERSSTLDLTDFEGTKLEIDECGDSVLFEAIAKDEVTGPIIDLDRKQATEVRNFLNQFLGEKLVAIPDQPKPIDLRPVLGFGAIWVAIVLLWLFLAAGCSPEPRRVFVTDDSECYRQCVTAAVKGGATFESEINFAARNCAQAACAGHWEVKR